MYFQAYEREIRAREGTGIRKDLDRMFNTLRDGAAPAAGIKVAHVAPRIAAGVAKKKKAIAPVTAHAIKFKATGPIKRPEAANKSMLKRRQLRNKKVTKRYVHKKLLRENVISQHFILDELKWSPWKLYSDYSDGSSSKNHKLFDYKKSQAAIYEIAVRTGHRCKNNVVMFRTTNGIPSGVNWDTYIMRGKHVQEQMKCVLTQWCSVVVRRAFVPRVFKYGGSSYKGHRQVATLLRQKYHYAWMKSGRRGDQGREIVRQGKVLSKVIH